MSEAKPNPVYELLTYIDRLVQRREPLFAGLLAVVVLLVALHGAIIKPLDHDEIFTLLVATVGSPVAVYQALLSGADNHPPVDHMVRSVFLQFGTSQVLHRLPTVLYFLGWLWLLYRLGKHLVGVGGGLMAMTLGIQSLALGQIINARMYGLSIFVLTCALWLWLRWESQAWRAVARTLFALLFFIAPLIHYYLPFWLLAIVLGEFVWMAQKRQIRWGLWACMGAMAPGAAVALPFAMNARSYTKGFWTPLAFSEVWPSYGQLLHNYLPLLLVAAVLMLVIWQDLVGFKRPVVERWFGFALGYLIALPMVIWVLSRITHAYSIKYALGAVVGGVFLLLFTSRALALPILTISLVLCIGICGLKVMVDRGDQRARASSLRELERRIAASDAPLVTHSSNLLLEHWISMDEKSRQKFMFVADSEMEMRFTKRDTASRGLLAVRRCVDGLQVITLEEFARSYSKVVAIEPGSWFVKWARTRGYTVEESELDGMPVVIVTNSEAVSR